MSGRAPLPFWEGNDIRDSSPAAMYDQLPLVVLIFSSSALLSSLPGAQTIRRTKNSIC
jgi:hypothetical protein